MDYRLPCVYDILLHYFYFVVRHGSVSLCHVVRDGGSVMSKRDLHKQPGSLWTRVDTYNSSSPMSRSYDRGEYHLFSPS